MTRTYYTLIETIVNPTGARPVLILTATLAFVLAASNLSYGLVASLDDEDEADEALLGGGVSAGRRS